MECDYVSAFIAGVQEYKQNRNEVVSVKLQRYLQRLTESIDRDVLDPNTVTGVEFFISLNDLMEMIEPRSGLMLSVVQTLNAAAENDALRLGLVHTFKFTPIFTQLLSDCTTNDERIQVLKLLQNCTYGVKIQWQESYLPVLMSTLIGLATATQRDNRIVSLALGVLFNLCFRNPPAMYTFKTSVDMKQLIHAILALPRDNLDIRVQAYKLLFILDEEAWSGDDRSASTVKWTFKRLRESYACQSSDNMTHIIRYFVDLKTTYQNFRNILLAHQSWEEDIDSVIVLLEEEEAYAHAQKQALDCCALLLEFLRVVMEFEPAAGRERHCERLLNALLPLVGKNTRLDLAAFRLVTAILTLSNHIAQIESQNSLIGQLDNYLQLVLTQMRDVPTGNVRVHSKHWLVELFSLILEMIDVPFLREKTSSSLDVTLMRGILSEDSTPDDIQNPFNPILNALYVKGVAIVLTLSKSSESWRTLCDELLACERVKSRLVFSLYGGDERLTRVTLKLLTEICLDSSRLTDICQHLSSLSALLVPIAMTLKSISRSTDTPTTSAFVTSGPSFSDHQKKQLDCCLDRAREAFANNVGEREPQGILLELYSHKVASLDQQTSELLTSLQQAERAGQYLRMRHAALAAESSRQVAMLHAQLLSATHTQQLIAERTQHLAQANQALCQQRTLLCAQITDEFKRHENLNHELTAKVDSLNVEVQEMKALNSSLMAKKEKLMSLIEHDTVKQKALEDIAQTELESKDAIIKSNDK